MRIISIVRYRSAVFAVFGRSSTLMPGRKEFMTSPQVRISAGQRARGRLDACNCRGRHVESYSYCASTRTGHMEWITATTDELVIASRRIDELYSHGQANLDIRRATVAHDLARPGHPKGFRKRSPISIAAWRT